MSAFVDGDNIVPVKFEIKEFSDKQNTLYVAITMHPIKKAEVSKSGTSTGEVAQNSRSANISISHIFEKINTSDQNFLKYVPDGFLSAEQIEAKNLVLAKDGAKHGKDTDKKIEIDFEFTGMGLRKSLNSQATAYGGSFADLAKVVLNLQKLLDNSVLIDIHSDKGKGTERENKQLVQTFVMVSAFADNNSIVPVQFEVKQFIDNANRLYLAVALTKIETSVMGNTTPDKNQASTYLLPVSSISISDLFSKININDENFFKYIPDGFLSGEQIEAKKELCQKMKRNMASEFKIPRRLLME